MGEEISEVDVLDRLEELKELHEDMVEAAQEATEQAEEKSAETQERDLDLLEQKRESLSEKLEAVTREIPDPSAELSQFLDDLAQDVSKAEGQDRKLDNVNEAREWTNEQGVVADELQMQIEAQEGKIEDMRQRGRQAADELSQREVDKARQEHEAQADSREAEPDPEEFRDQGAEEVEGDDGEGDREGEEGKDDIEEGMDEEREREKEEEEDEKEKEKDEDEEEKKKEEEDNWDKWAKAFLLLLLLFGGAFISGNAIGPSDAMAPGCSYMPPQYIRENAALDIGTLGRMLVPPSTKGGIPMPWNTKHGSCTGYTCTMCAFEHQDEQHQGLIYANLQQGASPCQPASDPPTMAYHLAGGCRLMDTAETCGQWTPVPQGTSVCQWTGTDCVPHHDTSLPAAPCKETPSICQHCLGCRADALQNPTACNVYPYSQSPTCTFQDGSCQPNAACSGCPTQADDFTFPSDCRSSNKTTLAPQALYVARQLQFACLNHHSEYDSSGMERCSAGYLQQQCQQNTSEESCRRRPMPLQCTWLPAPTPLPACHQAEPGLPCPDRCRRAEDGNCTPITGQCNWDAATNSDPQWMTPKYAFFGNMVPRQPGGPLPPSPTRTPGTTSTTILPSVVAISSASGCTAQGGLWKTPDKAVEGQPSTGFGWACAKLPTRADDRVTLQPRLVDPTDCFALPGNMAWIPVYYNPCNSCVNLQAIQNLPDAGTSPHSSSWPDQIKDWLQSLGMYAYLLGLAAVLALCCIFLGCGRDAIKGGH